MAFTIEQRIALEEAIAQGALRVKYADKEVEYRSLDEMLSLLELMNNQLDKPKRRTRFYARFKDGL